MKILATTPAPLLEKSDLQFEYTWTAEETGDDPEYKKGQERSEVNREQGYEVLYFIKEFAKESSITDKATGLEIERLIHEDFKHIKDRDKLKIALKEKLGITKTFIEFLSSW